jgi:hypothetical protein
MAKGEKCKINNCKNIISSKGNVCGTHKWRMKKYNSYDLPNYKGERSYFVSEIFPEGFVVKCGKHGLLTLEQTYPRKYKETTYYKCKKCILSLNIKKKYSGLNSIEDYEEILEKQKGVCDCCKRENTTTRNGKIKRFAIDHCHKTGKVRGLLCQFCNALMGYSRDSISILKSAIIYLEKHANNQKELINATIHTKDVKKAS